MNFQYPLGQGYIDLEQDSAHALLALVESPMYPVLRGIMEAMKQASDVALRNPSATIDALRLEQGKQIILEDLALILEVKLKEWREEGRTTKEGQDD
jgi:hypothetical protein